MCGNLMYNLKKMVVSCCFIQFVSITRPGVAASVLASIAGRTSRLGSPDVG